MGAWERRGGEWKPPGYLAADTNSGRLVPGKSLHGSGQHRTAFCWNHLCPCALWKSLFHPGLTVERAALHTPSLRSASAQRPCTPMHSYHHLHLVSQILCLWGLSFFSQYLLLLPFKERPFTQPSSKSRGLGTRPSVSLSLHHCLHLLWQGPPEEQNQHDRDVGRCGLPSWLALKTLPANAGDGRDAGLILWVDAGLIPGKIPGRRKWQPRIPGTEETDGVHGVVKKLETTQWLNHNSRRLRGIGSWDYEGWEFLQSACASWGTKETNGLSSSPQTWESQSESEWLMN